MSTNIHAFSSGMRPSPDAAWRELGSRLIDNGRLSM